MAMIVDTKEKLERALSKVGIVGEWINPDRYGFSRLYKFDACGTDVIIEWYCNYSVIMIGNSRMWFTHIKTYSGYPEHGEWIEFTFNGEKPLHLKIKE
jgi:hypothetical protein